MVVSDDLLLRLNVHTGDTLHIGGQDFRIAGVVLSEPDRMTGTPQRGPAGDDYPRRASTAPA